MTADTIVALSTPPGTSGLAVVRLSGPACRAVAARCLFRPDPMPRHMHHGAFRAPAAPGPTQGAHKAAASGAAPGVPTQGALGGTRASEASAAQRVDLETASPVATPTPGALAAKSTLGASASPGAGPEASGEIVDRLNYVFLPGPGTATGEDMLEIYPHGNLLLVERILEILLAAVPGIRLAGPGEFTRRALEHGKIDLLQAEAVGELIHAQTLDALRNAQRIAAGDLARPLAALRDALVDLSVRLELDVDFAEEEADPDFPSWLSKVEAIRASLASLAKGFERGRLLARTPRVVILGAPNAGKSSLVNALVEEERLLVSDIPGTTRDYVEVPLRLPGGRVHLVDTAGLGRPVDALDEKAMERTRAQAGRADLTLWVADGTGPQLEMEEGPALAGEALIKVRTRQDLPGFAAAQDSLSVSNASRAGLAELLDRMDDVLFRSRSGGEEDVRLATERQYRAVEEARERVEAAYVLLKGRPAIEILAFEIREAAKHLRDLLGEISADEVLQKVFAGFCIGK